MDFARKRFFCPCFIYFFILGYASQQIESGSVLPSPRYDPNTSQQLSNSNQRNQGTLL